ncbi:hypothetical protein CRG98_016557 [Punica granatum]|uniref:Uncharacterized protein n=1 Tax=Punica granatum TaxID=22663 RepID=A0A2I0K4H1_PUNGR|nr:hypothetical protein CRG98_016557 [Punica granatum]
MEQVSNCLSGLVLVSRVSLDPAKGPFQKGSSTQSSIDGKWTFELHPTHSLQLLGLGKSFRLRPSNQLLSKTLSNPSPLSHFVQPIPKAETDQNRRKTTRYSEHRPTRLKPNITKLYVLHISHPLNAFPSSDFPLEVPNTTFQPLKLLGPKTVIRCIRTSTTCHFIPRLRRVVPSRSKGPSRPSLFPVNRWSRSKSYTTVHNLRFTPFPLSGLGTFGTVYERLGPSLRSPMSPILHRAAVGIVVPTSFSPSCRCRCSRASAAHRV